MQPENGKNWKKWINYEGKFFTLLKHGKHGIQITLINRDCVYGQWVKSYSVIQHFRKQVTVFIFSHVKMSSTMSHFTANWLPIKRTINRNRSEWQFWWQWCQHKIDFIVATAFFGTPIYKIFCEDKVNTQNDNMRFQKISIPLLLPASIEKRISYNNLPDFQIACVGKNCLYFYLLSKNQKTIKFCEISKASWKK